jgi:hypothetical protein
MIHQRRKPKTTDDLYKHIKVRFLERYKLEINRNDFDNMNRLIKNQEKSSIQFIAKQSLIKSLYKIKWKDKWYPVIYHKEIKAICTVFLEDWLEEYK